MSKQYVLRMFTLVLAASALLICPAATKAGPDPETAGTATETAAAAPPAQEELATVEGLASGIIDRFPRAEGRVVSTDGKTLRLDMGTADGLRPGMKVLLSRPDRPIRHPVTKVVLGTMEEPLGSAVVTAVSDEGSDAEVDELLVTRIVEGDIGRLPTDREPIVLAVYGPDYNTLVLDRLVGRLDDSSRFEIIGPVELPAEPAISGQSAAGLVTENQAKALVLLKTTPTGRRNRTAVELSLLSGDGAVLEKAAGEVDITSEVYGEMVMNYPLVRGERRDFFRLEELPFRGKHMAVGDVLGDGKNEVVVSDGRGLVAYTFEEGIMREVWRDEGKPSDNHLSVECADLNGNGRDEIYVTDFSDGRMQSYVIEHDEKGFKKIFGPEPIMFRVLALKGGEKLLLTTTMGTGEPYSGIINEYAWEDGRLVSAGRFELPRKIKDPYGFVLADIIPEKEGGKPEEKKGRFDGMEIVWVDDADFLQVLDMRGKRIWRSPERYGGYDNFFEPSAQTSLSPNVDTRGKVKGRLILREDPDGDTLVVLTKNKSMTDLLRRFKGYSGAEIYALAWNGTEMEPRWSITNIDGYLADLEIGDIAGDGREGIAVLTEPTFKVMKKSKSLPVGSLSSLKDIIADRSSLLVYKVPTR